MDGIGRRRFLKLGLLALLGGCAPRISTVREPEYYFAKIDAALKKRREAPADVHLPPSEMPPAARVAKKDRAAEFWQPDIIPRDTWARTSPIKRRLDVMGRIYRMTVHHEGNPKPNYDIAATSVADDIGLIRKNHSLRFAAGDIGYHYVIDRAGRIWEGRPLQYQGAHVGGAENTGNLGVMLLGNFDIQHPSDAQEETLKNFLVFLKNRYEIGRPSIYTHQELKPSRCPGVYLQAYMDELRRTEI